MPSPDGLIAFRGKVSFLLTPPQAAMFLPQPISEPGSGAKGLPEFTALIMEPLQAEPALSSTHGSAPHGHPGDNQVVVSRPKVSDFALHHPLPRSPLSAWLPASSLPHPDSLQLPPGPTHPCAEASPCHRQVCRAGGGAHVCPQPHQPGQPHSVPAPLPLPTAPHQPPLPRKPRCSRPVAAIKYSWRCWVNKHYEFMTC